MNDIIKKNKFLFGIGIVSLLYFYTMYSVLDDEKTPNLRYCCEQLEFEKSYVHSLLEHLKAFIKNDDCSGLETFIEHL